MQTTYAKPETVETTETIAPAPFPVTNGNGNGSANRKLVDTMVNSKLYQEYERAFMEMTGLPVALRPIETWQLPHHGQRRTPRYLPQKTDGVHPESHGLPP